MPRATPLPLEERRAAIVAATEALVIERGATVSTREIAEAAGIAEGTIFRVFASKEELIDAVVEDAFDPLAARAELGGIDRDLPLEQRLVELVEILRRRVRRVFTLMHALGRRPPRPPAAGQDQRALAIAAIADLLAPDRTRLRISPEDAARLVNGLVLAMTHPILSDVPSTFEAPEIADLILHGVLRQPADRSQASHDSRCSQNCHESRNPC